MNTDLFGETEQKIKRALLLIGPLASEIDIHFVLEAKMRSQAWIIKDLQISKSDKIDSSKLYNYKVEESMWLRYLKDDCAFDDLAFGGHIFISQGNIGYSTMFHRILRNINSSRNLKMLGVSELSARKEIKMKKNHNGMEYEVSRYCPHQGFDLLNCDPNDEGIIVCPAHGWKFEICSGQCVQGDSKMSL